HFQSKSSKHILLNNASAGGSDEMSGGVLNVTVKNLLVWSSRRGVRIKTSPGCYNDNLALMLAPESDEVIRLEKENRSKLGDLIRPFDYEKLNNLYDLFVPQREKSSTQRYFSESAGGSDEMSGGVSNVTVENLLVWSSRRGVRIKTSPESAISVEPNSTVTIECLLLPRLGANNIFCKPNMGIGTIGLQAHFKKPNDIIYNGLSIVSSTPSFPRRIVILSYYQHGPLSGGLSCYDKA
nr:probable polygalacturonase [Tanacetum cinerariifolium]